MTFSANVPRDNRHRSLMCYRRTRTRDVFCDFGMRRSNTVKGDVTTSSEGSRGTRRWSNQPTSLWALPSERNRVTMRGRRRHAVFLCTWIRKVGENHEGMVGHEYCPSVAVPFAVLLPQYARLYTGFR
jgi:hypothetical protein